MLLLTTLTVGGSNETGVFSLLPPESRVRLEEKAQALLAIPSEKRVPFMVHEIKQALTFKGLRGVERMDPSWIVQGMKGEAPRTVATILISLPGPTVRSVLKRLPPGIRSRLPPKEEIRQVPLELVRSVRQLFEARFQAMPEPSHRGFVFRDVIQLERAELFRVIRELGLVELGQAFVAVGRMALAELCRRLPRDKAEELILAVRAASQVDVPDLKEAQRFLSRVVMNFSDTEEFFQKSGLWRIARASLIEDSAFRAGLRQRLPRETGQLYEQYMEQASENDEIDVERCRRLQDAALLRIRDLSRRGLISPTWATMEMSLHFPQVEGESPPRE